MFRHFVFLLCLFHAPGVAAQIDRQKELGDLRERIVQLREEVERASEDRKEAADDLRHSEKRISELNRRLLELRRDERDLGARLSRLAREQAETEAVIAEQESRLAELARERYRRGDVDSIRLLLSGRNPGDIQRDLGYFGYIGQARSALIDEHREALEQLARLEAETRQRQAELDRVKQTQMAQRQNLSEEQSARRDVYEKLSRQIRQQRQEIDSLVRDEQRLSRLIERLRRLAEEARAKKAAREREIRKNKAAVPGEKVDRVVDASLAGYSFPSLRGKLALPTPGEIVAKFGQARPGGGPAWKGLFIRTKTGQQVRAVGSGEVVFSDWLRGFGNLLIVDHGGGYLSLYSNNESLYKQAGEVVRAGDVIAATGNTGGHDEPGLYFELRRQGQPFDPLAWVK